MQEPQRKIRDINRLLSAYPTANTAEDAEQALRNYLLAVDDYPAEDVETAVDTLLKGTAPGVNPNFLPAAPAVGAECHRQNHLRAEREDRDRRLRPALPPPDIERTPESQAKVRELMQRTVNGLKAMSPDEDPTTRHRRIIGWANDRTDRIRWSVGDTEGTE
jgi:hypothetical protein